MAIAEKKVAEPSKPEKDAPGRLTFAALVGSIYIVAACVAVFWGVPYLWDTYISASLSGSVGSFMEQSLRILAQIATVVLLAVFGQSLAGSHPPKGLRGGIFVGISTLFTVFFFTRALAYLIGYQFMDLLDSDRQYGPYITAGVGAVMLFFGWRFLRSAKARGWMIALEQQGWFSTTTYKRNQGLRVRRMTMLGVILILGSGIYTLMQSTALATAPPDWRVGIPYTDQSILLLPDVRFTLPLILIAGMLWFTYRLVQVPTFADFLIATEAEINKVSWSTRKQLVRDTIVVLTTVAILAVFLLAVDLFWGWLLSREFIAVLPPDEDRVVVVEPYETPLQPGEVLTQEELEDNKEKYGEDAFTWRPYGTESKDDKQIDW